MSRRARTSSTSGGDRFTRDALEPDVLVLETSRDHFAGVDPVLEAALRRAGQ